MPNPESSREGPVSEPLVVRLDIAVVAPDGAPVDVRTNLGGDERPEGRTVELEARASQLASEALGLDVRERELDGRAERLAESERLLEQRAAAMRAERKRRDDESGRREEALEAQVADLNRELEEHKALAARLDDLRLELAEREADLALARRPNTKRLAEAESAMLERIHEVDQREAELDQLEAEREADFELREERLEHREQDLAQLEDRLRRKERELAGYVGQLQDELVRREAEWWEKLAGGDTIRH
jgi:chromosome segregation ATPase